MYECRLFCKNCKKTTRFFAVFVIDEADCSRYNGIKTNGSVSKLIIILRK